MGHIDGPITGRVMPSTAAWTLGLLGFLALAALCVTLHAGAIEADVAGRVAAAVPGATVSGRDVVLRGTVPTEAARAEAETTARRVRGVRQVRNELEVVGGAVVSGSGAGPTETPTGPFALTVAGGAVVVRGVVPNGAVRTSVLARVREVYPGRDVRDELAITAGATGAWETPVLALLPRLRGVGRPALSLEPADDEAGGVFVLGGTVASDEERAAVEATAQRAVAAPYAVRSELVVEDPAIGDQLEASGSTDADVVAAEGAIREALALGRVEFASGTADLTPASRQILDRVAAALARAPTVGAAVQGHTDAQGADASNLALSQDRAEAVAAYLAERGVASDALAPRGFGESAPIASNDTPEGRARNRRVVFALRRL